MAPTAITLEAAQDWTNISITLKEYAADKARIKNVIYNSYYIQASKHAPGTDFFQIQRSINRVEITEQHKTIVITHIQQQITRLDEKNQLDPRLQNLRKFLENLERGQIKTYQQLLSELSILESHLLYTPDQSKVGGFAKRHSLYQSTSASMIHQTVTAIMNDAYGVKKTSAPVKNKFHDQY